MLNKVEKIRINRKSLVAQRARSFYGGSSKGKLDIQYKPRFKKRFSNNVLSKFPKARYDKGPKPRSQMRKSGN